jgi:NAD(P)-dependent dehydrogenase (short-subunit alcohol dehydrogenase family)
MEMTDQKVGIVTGGSSGIGRAAAVALAKEGIRVVLAARREKEGEETLRLVREADSEGMFVKTDVSSEDDVKSLVNRTVEKYGRLDYAFNNAGFEGEFKLSVDQTSKVFDNVMNVNVKGVWLCMKYEIPEMLKNGGGAIVNNSSVAGVIGVPELSLYVASKHAVLGLTKSAALEYAKAGIRVNAVAPGGVETEMVERGSRVNKEFTETLISMHPMGRIGKPVVERSSWDLGCGADLADRFPLPRFSDAPPSQLSNVSCLLHVGTPRLLALNIRAICGAIAE